MAKYEGEWSSYASVKDVYDEAPPEEQIVYACYDGGSYDGWAIVVWKTSDGKWFENNDSHCSCYGLECWSPEETSPAVLFSRKGYDGLAAAVKEHTDGEENSSSN